MSRSLRAVAVAVVAALALTSNPSPATSSGPTADGASAAAAKAAPAAAKPNRPGRYRPVSGVLFNRPLGRRVNRFRIHRQVVGTIDATRAGERILVASWNVRSSGVANALIRAHFRGVTVRIVMDRINATTGNPNRDVRRVIDAFTGKQNRRRHPARRSFLKKCYSSCRYPAGIAHTKFYLFSRVGRDRNIVMYGSHNLTELAATIQWNDLYTFKNSPRIYSDFKDIFTQMARDRRVRSPFRAYQYGDNLNVSFYPYRGRGTAVDPTMRWLRNIQCQGARGGTGINGRTKVRIAQTAMYGDRGKRLAQRLATMSRRGCSIKVVYAMFGNEVLRILRSARVGLVHLANDSNDDGVYDQYVHMKSMAVSGVYGRNPRARIVFNGSANWTSVALASDEVVGVIRNARVTAAYMRHIDSLRRPPGWGSDTGGTAAARMKARHPGVDPYALIRLEN